MGNASIIEHKANMFYNELREDYIHICLQCKRTKPGRNHASPHCQALMLSIMERWTNSKRDSQLDLGVNMSIPQWETSLYGFFKRDAIIDSLNELVNNNLLSRQEVKTPRGGKPSYRYYLNYQEVNNRLRALPDRSPNQLEPSPATSINRPRKEEATSINRLSNIDKSTEQGGLIDVATSINPPCSSSPTLINRLLIDVIDSDIKANTDSDIDYGANRAETPAPSSNIDKSSSSPEIVQILNTPPKQTRKPRASKPEISPRVQHVYDVFSKLGQEATKDPTFHYALSKKATEAITEWLESKPTEELLREVYFELWNTPDDPRNGFSWKANMSIPAVLRQYGPRVMAIKARKNQLEARHVVMSSPALKPYVPEDNEDLVFVQPGNRRKIG